MTINLDSGVGLVFPSDAKHKRVFLSFIKRGDYYAGMQTTDYLSSMCVGAYVFTKEC